MSWMNEYLDHAQRISRLPATAPEHTRHWNAMEDDILGKLTIEQCEKLRDFCLSIPCAGSGVILAILPRDILDAANT